MAEQEVKKVEAVMPVAPTPVETKSDVAEGKLQLHHLQVGCERKRRRLSAARNQKLLLLFKKTSTAPKKVSRRINWRVIALADLEKEKRLSFIKAWEDNEKTKSGETSLGKSSMLLPHGRIAKSSSRSQTEKYRGK
ncbi:hypothetical protein OIU79_024986, partial [Salix purpurea]